MCVCVCAQWLPPTRNFQLIYLVYRWFFAIYFGGWLLYDAIISKHVGGYFLIYLTHWGYLFWMAYLLSAAIAVTANFIRTWTCNRVLYYPQQHTPLLAENNNEREEEGEESRTINCCRRSPDNTTFCDKLTWLLFIVGAEAAFLIAVLFWTTLHNSTSPISINFHLINGAVALLDLWVSGIPVFLLQFVYIQAFGAAYVGFTGIYFAFGNESAIYPVLDYQSTPGKAAGLAMVMAVVGTVVVHLIFLAQYLCRRYATARLLIWYKKMCASSAVHITTCQNSTSTSPSPAPSSSSSSSSGGSSCSGTTPIVIKNSKKHSTTHSSRESFF